MAFVITSPSITTFSNMTLKIMAFDAYVVMLNGIMLRVMTPKSTCCVGNGIKLSVMMLNAVMLNFIKLNVIMLSVVMLNVIMLSLVASKIHLLYRALCPVC
jgi:hypothetical protein